MGDRELAGLAQDLVRIDSRSGVSNLALAQRIEAELAGFEIERIDFTDPQGVAKRALVARRGPPGGYGLSGHMDTVPATGWNEDPWSGRIAGGLLHGLGSQDMKGPLAACILAARRAPPEVPVTLLLTTDEETTKQGAREILARSRLARGLAGIVVAEPTGMVPVRGHRASIRFTAVAKGVQAHSATGKGVNANWQLIPFLAEMRMLFDRLRTDPALQDPAYEPPFPDFNLVIDNHGTAVNVTVPLATAEIKFRFSAAIDPEPIRAQLRAAAARAGLELREVEEGRPPELAADHPLVRHAVRLTGKPAATAAFGTDASLLQALAPCLVLGPGSIATAHTPQEAVALADLEAACDLFGRLVREAPSCP
ncbi:MAG: M20/M25/M40 family metallo-hydrolase [Rhodovarius sp.]|nr:M20/M25/M40 family metallo-hydrolase [Rhodovarius sp.]